MLTRDNKEQVVSHRVKQVLQSKDGAVRPTGRRLANKKKDLCLSFRFCGGGLRDDSILIDSPNSNDTHIAAMQILGLMGNNLCLAGDTRRSIGSRSESSSGDASLKGLHFWGICPRIPTVYLTQLKLLGGEPVSVQAFAIH